MADIDSKAICERVRRELERADGFTQEQRRTLGLALAYEQVFRKVTGKRLYRVFSRIIPEIVQTPRFRTFQTVRKWLEKDFWSCDFESPGSDVGATVAFVAYVFQEHSPNIVFPGMLHNDVLRKQFLTQPSGPPADVRPFRDSERLRKIYQQVVDPEFAEEILSQFQHPPE